MRSRKSFLLQRLAPLVAPEPTAEDLGDQGDEGDEGDKGDEGEKGNEGDLILN